MNDHTPGPWEQTPGYPLSIRGDGKSIAQAKKKTGMRKTSPDEKTAEANARLIAEVPAMLEACQEIVECIRECHSCDATGIQCGTKADACYDCGGVGQVLGGDDIFAAFKARDLLERLAANDG